MKENSNEPKVMNTIVLFNYGYYQSSKSLIIDLEIQSLLMLKYGRAVVQSCDQTPMPTLAGRTIWTNSFPAPKLT